MNADFGAGFPGEEVDTNAAAKWESTPAGQRAYAKTQQELRLQESLGWGTWLGRANQWWTEAAGEHPFLTKGSEMIGGGLITQGGRSLLRRFVGQKIAEQAAKQGAQGLAQRGGPGLLRSLWSVASGAGAPAMANPELAAGGGMAGAAIALPLAFTALYGTAWVKEAG